MKRKFGMMILLTVLLTSCAGGARPDPLGFINNIPGATWQVIAIVGIVLWLLTHRGK